MLISAICGFCDAVFQAHDYVIRRSKNNYCSKACCVSANNAKRKNRVNTNCSQCGGEFEIPRWKAKKNKNNYCSRACYNISQRKAPETREPWGKTIYCIKDKSKPIYHLRRRSSGSVTIEVKSLLGDWDGYKTYEELNALRAERGAKPIRPSTINYRITQGRELIYEPSTSGTKVIETYYPKTTKLFRDLLMYKAPTYRPRPTFGYGLRN